MTDMTVGEICNRRIPTAPASTSVLEAAKSMDAFGDPFLVVTEMCEGKARAVGLVTDREITAVVAREADPRRLTIAEIMRPHPGFVTEGDGILETVLWMRHNGMRDVVVHDRRGALLGIVGMDRLIESLAAEFDGMSHSGPGESAALPRSAIH